MAKARRAKKSKISKKLIAILLVLAGILTGIIHFQEEIGTNIVSIMNGDIQSYDVNDYVKAIFTDKDGTRYLPIVYSNYEEQVTKADIEAKFAAAHVKVTNIPDTIKTGSKVETANATYTVIIYGDVDGDGRVSVRDAQSIVRHALYGEKSQYNLTGLSKLVANVADRGSNEINIRDAQRIVSFIAGNSTLIDTIPASDISKDKEAPELELLGDNPIIVEVGKPYVDPGATVKDKIDPNARLETDFSKIDINTVGTYYAYYRAIDAAGNVKELTREVIVEEFKDPVIEFSLDRLAINFGDDAAYEALRANNFGVTAKNEKDSDVDITDKMIINTDNIDFEKPGNYEITFTVTNSHRRTITKTKELEIIDPVTAMVLTGELPTSCNEGEKINTDEIYVAITKRYAGRQEPVPFKELGEDYAMTISPFEIAEYDLDNEGNNRNKPITATVTYTNPADNTTKEASLTKNMMIYGKVRAITNVVGFTGTDHADILEAVEIAQVKTAKLYQQQLDYNNNEAGDNLLTYTVTPSIGANGGVVTVKPIVNEANGTITVKFWARDPGTYRVALKAGLMREEDSLTYDITVEQGDKVSSVKLVPIDSTGAYYKDKLKVDGEAQDIKLCFENVYGTDGTNGTENTGTVSLEVKVTKKRLETEWNNGSYGYDTNIIYLKTEANGELAEATRDTDIVTGMRIQVTKRTGYVSSGGTTPDNRKMTVYVDRNNPSVVLSTHEVSIDIYPKSVYTVAFETNKMTLNLEKKQNNYEMIYQDESTGLVYNLLAAYMEDQYGERGTGNNVLKGSYLSVYQEQIGQKVGEVSKIVFIDSANEADTANTTSYIDVKGFVDSSPEELQWYRPEATDEISYIGIALKKNVPGANNEEDNRLEETGSKIKVYQNKGANQAEEELKVTLNRKEISTLKLTMVENEEHDCYDQKVVAKLQSGAWEKELTASSNITFSIEENKVNKDVANTNGISEAIAELVRNSDNTIKIDEDGLAEIEFIAPFEGEYIITAILNANRGAAAIESEPSDLIKITENTIVDSAGFRDSTGALGEYFGTVAYSGDGKGAVTEKISYCHDYINPYNRKTVRREISKENVPFASHVKFSGTSDISSAVPSYLEILPVNANDIALEDDKNLASFKCVSLRIRLKEDTDRTSTSFYMHIKIGEDAQGNPIYLDPQYVVVDIAEKVQPVNVKLESISGYMQGGHTVTDLYHPDYTGTVNRDGIIPRPSGVPTHILGKYFSVFKIKYINNLGQEERIPVSDIKDYKVSFGVSFLDEYYDDDELEGSISAIALNRSSDGTYSYNHSSDDLVEYVGISLLPTANNPTYIDVYLQGKSLTQSHKWPSPIYVNVIRSLSEKTPDTYVAPVENDTQTNDTTTNDATQPPISDKNNSSVTSKPSIGEGMNTITSKPETVIDKEKEPEDVKTDESKVENGKEENSIVSKNENPKEPSIPNENRVLDK